MQPGVRSNLSTTSELTRLLADLCLSGAAGQAAAQAAAGLTTPALASLAEEPAQSFGERLGQWLNWTDAIALSAALSGTGATAAQRPAGPVDLARELARTRAALTQAITQEGARLEKESPEAATDFTPLRRHYTAQQRAMETALQALRARLRTQLAASGADGARLAALDAVLDNALAPRERAVLAQVPTLLEERHARLRQAHRAALAAAEAQAGSSEALPGSAATDPTETAAAPAPWLPGLHQDLRQLLLAELDLRLQPLQGLLEALQHEKNRTR